MRVHFVYAGRSDRDRYGVAMGRLKRIAQRAGIPVSLVGSRTAPRMEGWMQRSPLSITANVFPMLQSRAKTLLYDWTEEIRISGGSEEILFGHPYPEDVRKVWNRACRDERFALRVAMFPLSHRMAEENAWFDPYYRHVDGLLGIMGPYWFDTWDESPFAHWKDKITRVDMAIDASRFPRVKKRFNPPGKRTFFYLGRSAAMKGTHLLSILFGLARQHRCLVIGSGPPVRNTEFRPWKFLDLSYMNRLALECDFFVTLGVSDPNPTTILECMAWGFPVCCTPQTGYYGMPEIIPMSITDMRHNLQKLDELQYAPEERLLDLADKARRLVETRFTWERFNRTVRDGLLRAAHARGVSIWDDRAIVEGAE